MNRADKLLAAGVLLVALLAGGYFYARVSAALNGTLPARAIVSAQGRVVRTIDLFEGSGTQTFTIAGRQGPATVEVAGGKVRMAEAPCPGHICMGQGWIGKPGESIVCVPGEIVIHVEGAAPVDAVTR
jgi:hypothetical protein